MRLSAAARAAGVAVIAAVVVTGCARMEPPPGGPIDRQPPRLLTVTPDSGAVPPKFNGEVVFQFDEVISEGGVASQGLGTGDLERLVIVSPTTRVPKVRWRRNRLTVAPAEGWRPNRVYRVELLPGITDLRRNRADSGAVVTFTTGAPAPTTTLTGIVVDWTTRRPVAAALVEALLLPDSLSYRTLADSNGKFALGPLPRGEYRVYGIADQNHDQRLGNREAYDSIRLAPAATDVGELWTFVHDTTPPRIDTVAVADSMSAMVRFSQMLDPKQQFTPAEVRLRHLPDSAVVSVTSLLPQPVDDSINRKPAPTDTARRDTVAVPPAPRPAPTPAPVGLTSRPQLYDHVVLRVATPWQPGGRYVLEIRGVRNVTGKAADVRGGFLVPAPKPVSSDSLKKPFPLPIPKKKP